MSGLRRYGTFDQLHVPVDDSGLRLGGKPLRDYGISLLLGGVEIGSAESVASFVSVPGRAGSVNRTLVDESGHAYVGRRTITMHIAATGSELDAWEAKIALGALDGTETTLEWGVMPGHYTGFLTVGDWTDEYTSGGVYHHSTCDLTMQADPYLVGDPRSFPISTDAVSVFIRGNRPAWPIIVAQPPQGTKRLYVTLGGSQIVYALPETVNGAQTLTIDCGQRTSTLASNAIFPSVDSDYPPLTPGPTTAEISAGTATVTYRPLYHI